MTDYTTSDKRRNPHLYTVPAIYERHGKRIEYLQSVKGVKSKSVFKQKRNHVQLTDEQIQMIKQQYTDGASSRELAREYKITQTRVCKICSTLPDYKTIAQSWVNRGRKQS